MKEPHKWQLYELQNGVPTGKMTTSAEEYDVEPDVFFLAIMETDNKAMEDAVSKPIAPRMRSLPRGMIHIPKPKRMPTIYI
jgi:hypothetical protein